MDTDLSPLDSLNGLAPVSLETDYLIVGCGAVGMAFADTMLAETDANLIIVDNHHKPGGHWNDAYPFVTLHQPSAFYGVSSRELSKGRKDPTGLNQGLYELATGAEVSAYFDEVMRHQFLPSGRVQYFPMCEFLGDGQFKSITTGRTHQVKVHKKTVDATFLKTTVPSTHTPGFEIAPEAWFHALNELPKITKVPAGIVVIGGGKTGIDACLWLLEMGVDPDTIRWIMPRDGWLLDRKNTQPTDEFFDSSIGTLAAQTEAIASAESIYDLFDRLEAAGVLLRIDQAVRPQMFHGATVSQAELTELRRIKNIIRMGRVQHLGFNQIVLDQGTIPTGPDHLHVDCSASAAGNLVQAPIFQGDTIVPQTVRSYQPIFSAAFVAHIEATYDIDRDKNRICGVVPLPNHDTDWIRGVAATMMNQAMWAQEEGLREWLLNNRLDGFSQIMRNAKNDPAKRPVLERLRANAMPAMGKLQQFLQEISASQETSA